jgi:hypothetical protein
VFAHTVLMYFVAGTLVTETICQITATVGSWGGVGLGSWQAPAEVPCIAGLTALQ